MNHTGAGGPGGGLLGAGSTPLLLASPFARAQETAVEVMLELQANGVPADVETEPALAERWFGELEGSPDSVYSDVWEGDRLDPTASAHGVESVESVAARARSPRLCTGVPAHPSRPCSCCSALCSATSGSPMRRRPCLTCPSAYSPSVCRHYYHYY